MLFLKFLNFLFYPIFRVISQLISDWHARRAHGISHPLTKVIHSPLVLLGVGQDLCGHLLYAHLFLLFVVRSRRILHQLLYFVHSIGILTFSLLNVFFRFLIVRDFVLLLYFLNHYLFPNIIRFPNLRDIRLKPLFKLLSQPLFFYFENSFQLLLLALLLLFFSHSFFFAGR